MSENTPTQVNESDFHSKQSLHRSLKQAEKYLPNSPRKKNEVLDNLASKYNLRIKLKNKRGPKKQYLSENQEYWLLEMLERPDMTYTNPRRKYNVYIGKIDGERCYVQKRYLLWNLRDALEILNDLKESFKEKFGEPLTFTKFYQFIKKKKQFIFQRDIPDTSCLCKICKNATLMAKAIQKEKGHPTTHMMSSKNTRAIPPIQIALVTGMENAL